MTEKAAEPRSSLNVFLVAGESSGDALGAGLMRALAGAHPGVLTFRGVGGPQMAAAGLASLFPMEDVTAIGVLPVVSKIPSIWRRLRQTIHAVIAAPPDVLVLIDAPDFTHRVGKRVRQALPRLPIVKYVSPTVWAWRPGRAPAMRRWCDLVLALFPFEPEVHRRLGGPPCTYVGHPLLERLEELRPSPEEANARFGDPPLVLALPGSRRQEVTRLGPVFGDALGVLAAHGRRFELVLATLPQLAPQITEIVSTWPVRPRIVTAEAEKYAAFRRARGAIAASGTVTLELALAQVPHVAAYRVPLVDEAIARIAIRAESIILANLVLGDKVVPELLQRRCTAPNLAQALADVIDDSPARRSQIEAFRRLDAVLGIGGGPPSERAARAVIDLLRQC